MENEIERRSSKRFEVKLPSTLIYPTGENKGVEYHFLLSRDISSNGAYFNTVKPITYDGPVQIEILIEVSKESNHYVYMTTSGRTMVLVNASPPSASVYVIDVSSVPSEFCGGT